MAYTDSFADYMESGGGRLDRGGLPEPDEIYDAVMALGAFYGNLSEIDRAALDLVWSTGPTAETFAAAGTPVPRWLLDSIDEIEDLDVAVQTAYAAIQYAADEEAGG